MSTAATSAAWRRDIPGAIADLKPAAPDHDIDIRGQNEVMHTSFTNLGAGLILAVILVYALLVVLFQSWVDPVHHHDGACPAR